MTEFPKHQDASTEPPRLSEIIGDLLPENASSRLARMLDVGQRTAQKWIAGPPVPDDVMDTVSTQLALLAKTAFGARLHALIEECGAAGLHQEVIASHLSEVYGDMTGQSIR